MTPRPDRIPFRPDPAAGRSRAVNLYTRLVCAGLLRADSGRTLDETLERHWSTDQAREIGLLARAASSPLTTATSALAQTTSKEFLLGLSPQSAGAALLQACSVSASVSGVIR